jgi:D-alanyl-D-alanine carboxypeptidase/D-alanyl-D-alanine-endopeptidase (penicillin-binding protein 4)
MVLSRLLLLLALTCSVASADDGPQLSAADAAYPLGALLAPVLEDPVLDGVDYGVQVVNLRTGEEVFARNGQVQMVPASVNKILTTAVALKTLGPGHIFSTVVSTEAEVSADGTLLGDLYIRGSGDPTLVSEKLYRIVADLPLMGIKRVQGDVVFDDSYFDDSWLIAGWNKRADIRQGPAYFAPITALGVNFSTVCIIVAPAGTSGAPARVVFETPIPMVSLTNQVKTGSTGSRTRIEVLRTVEGDKVHFKLTGTIKRASTPSHIYKSIAEPRPFFRQMFKVAMDERGISVTGEYRQGRAPKGARQITKMDSDTLGMIVGKMNKYSSNYMAETLLKAVGAEAGGRPGSTEKGLVQMRKLLVKMGNTPGSFTVVNGSGLSRKIMVSPSLLNGLMAQMYWDRVVGPEFVSSMSIGGEDGTLRYRYRDSGRRGRIRGKTGSLSGVYTLTAFVDGGDGEPYVMTFLTTGIRGGSRKVRRLQDRFAAKLLDMPAER